MANKIKTYKERPECAVPNCNNESIIFVAGRWICGPCCAKWDNALREEKRRQDENMFNQIIEVVKNDN